ncbi:hypothetical protein [Neptunomonas sp.]|uniref:hypothetical protein n=1 Tax=Neptunomonas sp. TaxID=1971898 RepID=UPI003569CBD7
MLSPDARRALVHSIDLDSIYTVKVYDEFETEIGDITDLVTSCSITHANFVTVHRSCTFTCRATLRWGRDRIKVVMTIFSKILGLSEEVSLGVFIPTWPENSRLADREIVAYDKMWLLDHNLANNISLVDQQPIVMTVQDILRERGVFTDAIDLSRSNDVSGGISTWNADDEENRYSTVINDLLGMVGYAGIHFDGNGLARSAPYVRPELKPISWKYSAGEVDNIIDAEDEGSYSTNHSDIPNRWRFYRNDNDERETPPTEGDGYFFYDNKSNGPNSQDALGGLVIPKTMGLDATSQVDLESRGWQVISADILANETARFTTFLNPYHGHFDVLNLQEHLLGAVGRYQHIRWTLDLDNKSVEHEVRRVQGGVV